MKNKVVGGLVIGIALLMGFVIVSFNVALGEIVNASCSHGASCPMWGSIKFQTNVSIGIMVFVVLIGLYLIFFAKEEKIITRLKKVTQQIKPRKITKESYAKIISKMNPGHKKVFEKIIGSQGTIFQSKLVEKTGLGKVKVTRILDRLEGKGLIERKRRGMTNVVILKHK